MGTATIASTELGVVGAGPGGRWIRGRITLSSAYAVGGDTLSGASLGLKVIKDCFIDDVPSGFMVDGVISADFSSINFKVFVFGSASTSAAAPFESSVRDLSTVAFTVLIRGY